MKHGTYQMTVWGKPVKDRVETVKHGEITYQRWCKMEAARLPGGSVKVYDGDKYDLRGTIAVFCDYAPTNRQRKGQMRKAMDRFTFAVVR